MKILKYIGIALLICGILFAAAYFIKTNNKSVIEYETQSTIVTSIERKTVVTGKVIPEDEVEIKPQIQGIIETLFVEEGDLVNTGDLLARIKVVPNEQNLNSAQGRLANSKIVLKNSKIDFDRSKDLFSKGIISKQEFENSELQYSQSKQDVSNATSDLQIIRSGSAGGAASANTNIRATVPGTILEIPVEEGFQVIASNSFNAGTTIATIADLNKMIFEGLYDSLCSIDTMIVGFDQLLSYILRINVFLDCLGTFIISDIEFGFEPTTCQIFIDVFICLDHFIV